MAVIYYLVWFFLRSLQIDRILDFGMMYWDAIILQQHCESCRLSAEQQTNFRSHA